MSVKKIVILFSGDGGNFENIVKQLHKKRVGNFSCEVVGAICNNKTANGIKRAEKLNIPIFIIEHNDFSSREEFDKKLVEIIQKFSADLTVLAGFMRILTPVFTQNIKAINLHPSLLPLFKGARAIEKSFFSDMKVGGVSVHKINDELDGGKIIAQKCFQKTENETLKTFTKKIKKLEFELLPKAIIKTLKEQENARE